MTFTLLIGSKSYKMKEKNQITKVFTGTELLVKLLKDELEQIGISSIIQNDYNSGVLAGFSGGTPSTIDLFIQESDLKKAEPIIRGFIQRNKG